MTWRASLFTLFPGMFPGPLGISLAGDALERGIWACEAIDIRDHGRGRHRSVDDRPAGGGAGMVMRADVIAASLDARLPADDDRPRLLMSPRGARLTQTLVRDLTREAGVAIVCGRFEGIDERVIAARGLTEISVGDFVLSGGEIGAMVLLDACVRLLPGVMGADASGIEESFEDGLLEYPHYTRPRDFEGQVIPDVLLSGDHARIAGWRRAQSVRITQERRPDLAGLSSSHHGRIAMPSTTDHQPPFVAAFERAETGSDWIAVRHLAEGHWWRFSVAEKNGRRQLLHDAHRTEAGSHEPIETFAVDAYDFATLEARRMGWVD